MNAISIVAFLALFVVVGFVFLLVNLLVGRLLRPKSPNAEKLEVYECGEPAIGTSFVQFDLRFYVVALLFLIFDVEVAFFFPWGTVFGKATQLMDPQMPIVEASTGELTAESVGLFKELGVSAADLPLDPAGPVQATEGVRELGHQIALASVCDILVFFAVLMVGFFYVWKRGDLNWVRAVDEAEEAASVDPLDADPSNADTSQPVNTREPVLST
jgi:NADH-quinone oxidoreductase subunit A